MDFVLKELARKEEFTKEEFAAALIKHRPLNDRDPVWSFAIEEEIKKYLSTGAFVQRSAVKFAVTEEAKLAVERQRPVGQELARIS